MSLILEIKLVGPNRPLKIEKNTVKPLLFFEFKNLNDSKYH